MGARDTEPPAGMRYAAYKAAPGLACIGTTELRTQDAGIAVVTIMVLPITMGIDP